MKTLKRLLVALPLLALGVGAISLNIPKHSDVAFATYTNGDAATYYSTIDETQSGNTLLTALRTLNLSKRQSTVGYSSMGTTPSGQFKYTDYDTSSVQYDSNGQPYGTKISSFYTYTSATSWNREHVWPNSHGGGSGGDAGSPYPDADIHMPRPTISSENSSRGNSFFVEGMNHSSNGWDPYTAGYSAESRGEAARITFYCTLVNSKLILAPNNTTPSGTDSVTGQSYGSGHTMGNLETLIKWNINYPVTQREKNRNEGAEYLQGNRNAFVDHPEYACKIWGGVNNTIKNLCANASWDTGPSVSISRSTASITVDDTTMINATSSDGSAITWSTSDNTVVSISSASSSSGANITLTGVGPGTATITARATIESTVYSAQCTVTVSSSGSGGGGEQEDVDSYSIIPTDLASAYPTTATSYTAASGISVTAYYTANYSSKIQFKKGQGYLYNNDSLNLGTLTLSGLSGTVTVYAGTTRNPSTTTITGSNGVYDLTGYNYFKIVCGSGSVVTCSSISVGIAESSSTKTLSSIAVATAPTKTTYTAGETFDPTGLIITRNYSDSTSDTYTYAGHTSEFTFDPSTATPLTTSDTSVEITYGGESCNQSITVNAAQKTLSSISVSTAPTKTTYTAGEYFDPTGLVITRNYSDSTSDTYTYAGHTSEFTFSPTTSTALTTSNVSVTITYSGKSCSQAITVNAAQKTLSSIAISNEKTSYTVGDSFVKPTVTATFSDSTQSDVTSSATCTGYNMDVAGNYTVTVSYTYSGTTKTTSYGITVSSSGGSGGNTESGSQRIVSKAGSSYFETGSIYLSGSTTSASASCDAFTATQAKNSSSNNVVLTYDEIRVYGSHSFMITPNEGYTITSVDITANNSTYATALGAGSLTNCTKDVSNASVTLTPTDGTQTLGFTNGSSQSRLNYVVVNYEYETSGSTEDITSISATANKTFYVGETITKSDITVTGNTGQNVTSSSSFTSYTFTYSDAASGGALTSKTFTNAVSYNTLSCSLTVQVQRKAYATPSESSLEHTGAEFSTAGIGSSYAANQTATVDGVTFNVSGYIYSSKLSLSDSKTSAKGSLINTTAYPSGITNVTVSGATPDIQLSTDGSSWVDLASTTPDTVNYYYLKVFYKTTTQSNYVNISSITVTLKGSETPNNVANYIMYEDTTGQCTSKFDTAKACFEGLSKADRVSFMTSNDYVISTARERFEAWANYLGKSIVSSGDDYVITNARVINLIGEYTNTNTITIVIIISSMGLIAIGGYFFLRRRKENN